MDKLGLTLIAMAIFCWGGVFYTDPRPFAELETAFYTGLALWGCILAIKIYIGLSHKRETRVEEIIQEVSYSKPLSIQSSVEMQKMNKHMHMNYMRANEGKRNCGRKPKYKNHHQKDGVKRKEMMACWNM